jgi:probable HAF family extracellular repeat protein
MSDRFCTAYLPRRLFRAAKAVLLAGFLTTGAAAQAASYNLVILPGIPGGNGSSDAWSISNARQATGQSYTPGGFHAFRWSASLGMQDLGAVPNPIEGQSGGRAINNKQEIAGFSDNRAIIWSAPAGMHKIAANQPNGRNALTAWGLNDYSEVVGEMGLDGTMTGEGNHAYLWSEARGLVDLGDLPGGEDHSNANAINNRHQVVGYGNNENGQHPMLWTAAAGMRNLGNLPNTTSCCGQAYDINESGQVVGTADGDNFQAHGFLWTEADGMKQLEDLPGVGYSRAFGINEGGQIVGQSGIPSPSYPPHAVLWDVNTGIVDLNTLVDAKDFVLIEARKINDACVIVGIGLETSSSHYRGFIAWPKSSADCPCKKTS